MFSTSLSRGHAAARGILAALAGTAFMVWPGITIGTVAALFALYVFADAGLSVAQIFRDDESAGDRVVLGLRAAIEAATGIAALAYPGITAAIMTVIAGLYLIAAGGLELAVAGRFARAAGTRSGWAIAGGVLTVLTGVALVIWPGIGAVTLAIVFGAYVAVSGLVLLIQAARTPRGAVVVPA
jgi:uncharacterized membrane protein HdeD (DUF308 family)